ncbi:uncharacterized protein EDB91DRAFT_1105767 [Suillus paluster]|uniref:uncharacterized protein n=1 Tax=Suillus paluster TaxID=48578 RepID=UPI001B85E6B1|nr:uncharacterized protein EDB91DRAFT_1105767 [Suillus paluster]KAG1751497.1 hypothetical protein EDB91DRAFT_1105767 [Suillus paluster]
MDELRQDIQKLMSWLDRSIWIKCRPACGREEMCFLPTWPVNSPKPKDTPPLEGVAHALFFLATPAEYWRKPQSKCISRLQPYGF